MRELFAKPFFPDLGFAWLFVVALIAASLAAAVVDTKTAIIPKWITLGMLGLGIVLNLVRGIWLGSLGTKVWILSDGSWIVGAADGLMFALAGAVAAFVLYFLMWIFGVCGGGDVKLMTALGAWFGPYGVVLFLMLSTVGLVFWVLGMVLFSGASLKSLRKSSQAAQSPQKGGKPRPQRRVTFSAPAAFASIVLVFWVFGQDLGVPLRKPAPQQQGDARGSDSPTQSS